MDRNLYSSHRAPSALQANWTYICAGICFVFAAVFPIEAWIVRPTLSVARGLHVSGLCIFCGLVFIGVPRVARWSDSNGPNAKTRSRNWAASRLLRAVRIVIF